MIQLNLLPDVKLEYIKARRTKRLVTLGATIVASASVAIMVLLFIATNFLQRQHMGNLAKDIEHDSHTLEEEKDLNRILTVQNQLNVLDDLHAQKPAAARLGTYFAQLVPTSVSVSKVEADFSGHVMRVEGSALSLGAVNQFIDTLKFTTFSADKEDSSKAFSNVVLTNFERGDAAVGSDDSDPVSYQINFSFDPVIFDNTKTVKLTVPATITTQSADRVDPNTLFQENGGH